SIPVLLVLVEAVSFRVANRPNGSFMSSGRKREYLLYVPSSYDRSKPTPLVISLHGAGMWGAAQKETSQWNRGAGEQGFIVGSPRSGWWELLSWCRFAGVRTGDQCR